MPDISIEDRYYVVNKRVDYVKEVRKFHKAFKHPAPMTPQFTWADEATYILREALIKEEGLEVVHALSGKEVDLVELADGLCDLLYVAAGALVVFGQQTHQYAPRFQIMDVDGEELAFKEICWLTNEIISFRKVADNKMNYWVAPLTEIIYRAEWIAHNHGIPLRECFEEVQRSNMSKLGEDGKPIYHANGPKKGKVKKGPNYTEPDLAKILRAHGLIK